MKVLAGRRHGAPGNGGPRPEQRGGTSPQSLVLALQRSAGNRAVTTLIARSPTLKGGAKLDSLENITKHAEATYKAYTEYCATKLLAEYVTTWAEDAAWAYIEEANGEVTLEELLSALKQRFDEMLAGIPPEQKASEQKPAAVPKPQPRLPYGTSAPAPAPTAPGPLVARPAPWGILWLPRPGGGGGEADHDDAYARFLREPLGNNAPHAEAAPGPRPAPRFSPSSIPSRGRASGCWLRSAKRRRIRMRASRR